MYNSHGHGPEGISTKTNHILKFGGHFIVHRQFYAVRYHPGVHSCPSSARSQAPKRTVRPSVVKFVSGNELLILHIWMLIYNLVSKLEHSGKSQRKALNFKVFWPSEIVYELYFSQKSHLSLEPGTFVLFENVPKVSISVLCVHLKWGYTLRKPMFCIKLYLGKSVSVFQGVKWRKKWILFELMLACLWNGLLGHEGEWLEIGVCKVGWNLFKITFR